MNKRVLIEIIILVMCIALLIIFWPVLLTLGIIDLDPNIITPTSIALDILMFVGLPGLVVDIIIQIRRSNK